MFNFHFSKLKIILFSLIWFFFCLVVCAVSIVSANEITQTTTVNVETTTPPETVSTPAGDVVVSGYDSTSTSFQNSFISFSIVAIFSIAFISGILFYGFLFKKGY